MESSSSFHDTFMDVTAKVKTLHSEISTAESIIHKGIDSLWHEMLKVMEQKIQEYESKNDLIEKENSLLKKKIEIVTKQKSDLEIHNTEVLTELDNSVKNQQLVDEKLKTAQSYFTSQEHDMNEKLLRLDKEHKCEVCSLQTKIKEQSTILKEYQDKVTETTGKMQKLSHHFTSDKIAHEREKKKFSDEISLKNTEIKKMTLELSTVKSQVMSSNKAASMAKEDLRKIQAELNRSRDLSDSAKADLQKQQSSLKVLKEKIVSLENEIEKLKSVHRDEIDQLRKAHTGSDRDDYLDARITFLHHQNRQEKGKILKEKKR